MKHFLDKIFKSKLGPQRAEFQEDHWKAMEALLDGKDEDKKPIGFFSKFGTRLLGALVVFLFIGSGLLWKMLDKDQSTENNQRDEVLIQENKSKIELETVKIPAENQNAKANKTSKENESKKIKEKENENQRKIESKNKAITKEQEIQPIIDRSGISTNITDPNLLANNAASKPVSIKEKADIVQPVETPDEIPSEWNKQGPVNKELPSLTGGSNKKDQAQNSSATTGKEAILNPSKTENERVHFNQLSPKEKQARENQLKFVLSKLPLLSLSSIDFSQNKLNAIESYTHSGVQIRRKPLLLGLTANVIVNPNQGKRILGFEAGVLISKQVDFARIQTGVNYIYRGGNFSAIAESEQRSYSFGRDQSFQRLMPTSLHYLELPILINKRFKSNELSLGIFTQFLFAVRANIDEKKNTEAIPNLEESEFHYRRIQ